MRFIWLSLVIVTPLIAVNVIDETLKEPVLLTYLIMTLLIEIIMLSFTVSAFVKSQKREEYTMRKRIESDRDEDIAKWRQKFMHEFMQGSMSLFDKQNESPRKAKEPHQSSPTVDEATSD